MTIQAQPVVHQPNPETPAPAQGAPSRKESFNEAMERIGKAQEGDPEPAEAAPEKPAARPKVVEAPAADDEGEVTVRERAAWRETRRKQHEAFQAERAKGHAELEKMRAEAQAEIEFGRSIRKAYEDNDPNALAKLLGAEDWNKLEENYISRLADPNYKELQSVKRKLEEREKGEEETKKTAEARARAEAHAQAVQAHIAGMSNEMKEHKNPALAALAEDAWFVHTVFNIQKRHWDGESTISFEQALDKVPEGGQVTLREQLRAARDRLIKAFPPEGLAAAAPPVEKPKKPAPKSAPVPPSASPAPSAPARFEGSGRFHSNQERVERFRRVMNEAYEEDRQALKRRGAPA